MKHFKPYLRWFIFGLTLFFLVATLRSHWQEVSQVRLDRRGWSLIAGGLAITAIAHVWSAMVWAIMLQLFRVEIKVLQGVRLYLRTNLAKYLPGNIWHFYGRMLAVVDSGSPWGVASLSVLLEPLLMAAAAVVLTIIGLGFRLMQISPHLIWTVLILLGLTGIFVGIHPKLLNPVIQKVSKGKTQNHDPVQLAQYPWQPLLGEIVFVLMRGCGFLLVWWAIAPLEITQIPQLLGVYSGAWLAGFIVPGAPGGIGVFETVAIALLETVGKSDISLGSILTIVAILRVVSILAEILPLGIFGWRSPIPTPSNPGGKSSSG